MRIKHRRPQQFNRCSQLPGVLGAGLFHLEFAGEGGHGGADPCIVRDFIELVRTGRQPLSTPLAGRMSVATGVAATRSIRAGGRAVNIKALPDWYKADAPAKR